MSVHPSVCQSVSPSEIKTPLISDIRLIIYLISQISKISDLSEFWSLIFQNSDLSDLLRTLICQNSQISDLSYFWYFRSLILMISDIYELWSILSLINLFFDVSDQKPLSLSESVLSTIKPIDHRAYQPLSLMSIEPIDHRAYWPSILLTIKPMDHWVYRSSSLSASGLLSRLLSLSACIPATQKLWKTHFSHLAMV